MISCAKLFRMIAIIYSAIVLCLLIRYSFETQATNDTIELRNTAQSSPIVFWSSDFHIGPVSDIKDLMTRYNVKFIDKSLSGHCHLTRSCQTDLKVLDRSNGLELHGCPNSFRNRLFQAYQSDPELNSVDAFIFTYSNALAEAFMSFNRSIIVIACTRFQTGKNILTLTIIL